MQSHSFQIADQHRSRGPLIWSLNWPWIWLWIWLLVGCGMQPRLLPPGELPLADYMAKIVMTATEDDVLSGRVEANSYIVAFRQETGRALPTGFGSFQSEYQYHYAALSENFLADPRITTINYIDKVDMRALPDNDASNEDIAAPPALRLAWQNQPDEAQVAILSEVQFVDQDSALSTLKDWEEQGRIWFAEPNYVNELMSVKPKGEATTLTLANTYTDAQKVYDQLGTSAWWHKSIKLSEAYGKIAASSVTDLATPVIAVLDSGVDVKNPVLDGRIWNNESPGQSGCDNDIYGCDTTQPSKGKLGKGSVYPFSTTDMGQDCPVNTEGKPDESCAHGTHVAGIIAGNVSSGKMGGVCPVCQVMVIKIIKNVGGKGVALDSAILNGLKYLTLFKKNNSGIVRIANTSFGKYTRSRAVSILVSALKRKPNEVLLIGAAGNEDSMQRVYPAALNDSIAVAATGPENQKAYYSNFGPWVDVAAPGGAAGTTGNNENDQILSSVPGSTIVDVKQGTSMAAPVVAGIAGMILSADPTRSWQALRGSLVETSDQSALYADDSYNSQYYYPKVKGENVRRPLLGAGLVDASAAFDNKTKTGVPNTALRRVSRGCSVIGLPTNKTEQGRVFPLLLILALGLGPFLLSYRRLRA